MIPERPASRQVLGEQIRLERRRRGLTQTDLSKMMTRKRTPSAISDMERGRTNIADGDYKELVAIFGREVIGERR